MKLKIVLIAFAVGLLFSVANFPLADAQASENQGNSQNQEAPEDKFKIGSIKPSSATVALKSATVSQSSETGKGPPSWSNSPHAREFGRTSDYSIKISNGVLNILASNNPGTMAKNANENLRGGKLLVNVWYNQDGFELPKIYAVFADSGDHFLVRENLQTIEKIAEINEVTRIDLPIRYVTTGHAFTPSGADGMWILDYMELFPEMKGSGIWIAVFAPAFDLSDPGLNGRTILGRDCHGVMAGTGAICLASVGDSILGNALLETIIQVCPDCKFVLFPGALEQDVLTQTGNNDFDSGITKMIDLKNAGINIKIALFPFNFIEWGSDGSTTNDFHRDGTNKFADAINDLYNNQDIFPIVAIGNQGESHVNTIFEDPFSGTLCNTSGASEFSYCNDSPIPVCDIPGSSTANAFNTLCTANVFSHLYAFRPWLRVDPSTSTEAEIITGEQAAACGLHTYNGDTVHLAWDLNTGQHDYGLFIRNAANTSPIATVADNLQFPNDVIPIEKGNPQLPANLGSNFCAAIGALNVCDPGTGCPGFLEDSSWPDHEQTQDDSIHVYFGQNTLVQPSAGDILNGAFEWGTVVSSLGTPADATWALTVRPYDYALDSLPAMGSAGPNEADTPVAKPEVCAPYRNETHQANEDENADDNVCKSMGTMPCQLDFDPFEGSSAAAAHAAGFAVHVIAQFRADDITMSGFNDGFDPTPAQIRARMISYVDTTDSSVVGDNLCGAGILHWPGPMSADVHCGLAANAYDNVIVGTDQADVLIGTDGDDLILAKGGNDSVQGGLGADCIDGGPGNDKLSGGAGNDTILGGEGAGVDNIKGGAGDDTLNGGDGNDIISGGDGGDTIDGDAGDDQLSGNAGNDTIDDDEGNNVCSGGAGTDTVSCS